VGIDYHGLRFLKYARQKQAFGSVATIGRQGLHLPPWRVRQILGLDSMVDFGTYCERLLMEQFSATLVESYDNSDYESATYVRDMNRALSDEKRYDTIIDAGCLEHIYNVSQALENVSALVKPGGQILHVLPANGFCGHGFWQFSPELFFSLYSEANGYRETEVFLADLADERSWYIVKKPCGGKRADVVTSRSLYVMVRTCLARSFCHDNVQQSDYAFAWNQTGGAQEPRPPRLAPLAAPEPAPRRRMPIPPIVSWASLMAYRKIRSLLGRTSLTDFNPYLTTVDIRRGEPGARAAPSAALQIED